MMKEDPGRVRADLVHAFGLIYVTCDKTPVVKPGRRLTLVEKLHGMFPRQYPSRWVDRSREVDNDNRPYADSPLWLLDSACRYLRETGDTTILSERVKSVTLTNPQDPVHSAMIGCDREFLFAEVMLEILESFQRMAQDSPYGLAQIMYGDWCDPVDMFGTFPVGDAASRGKGRGVQVRLSAHAFLCAVEVLDALSAPNLRAFVARNRLQDRLAGLKRFAHELRRNVVKWGWEDSRKRGFHAGFLSCIHELRRDGSVPDYAAGETGYTLGSMQRRDFDRENRRELCANAFGLAMLLTQRDYLTPIADSPDMVGKIVQMAKELFYDPKLGLLLFTRPIPNTPDALRLVGRMGMIPAGTAENGEYHHGQMFMHRFMQELPAEVEACYRHFLPMLSAMRDETLGGPFDTPSTSYASDRQDPHFGKGMYFGLSGSTDWIVDYFEALAGLRLNLADASRPDVVVAPRLPRAFQGAMTYRRILHVWNGKDGYRRVPLEIAIRHARGGKASAAEIRINGKRTERAVVESLHGVKRLKIDFALAEGARFDGQ